MFNLVYIGVLKGGVGVSNPPLTPPLAKLRELDLPPPPLTGGLRPSTTAKSGQVKQKKVTPPTCTNFGLKGMSKFLGSLLATPSWLNPMHATVSKFSGFIFLRSFLFVEKII